MHHQDAVEEHIGKGQRIFLAQHRGVAGLRPDCDAQRRRHGGDRAFGAGEGAQIGDGKAIAQQPVVAQVGPKRQDFAQDGPPRQPPQRRIIEGGKTLGILRHGAKIDSGTVPDAIVQRRAPGDKLC